MGTNVCYLIIILNVDSIVKQDSCLYKEVATLRPGDYTLNSKRVNI